MHQSVATLQAAAAKGGALAKSAALGAAAARANVHALRPSAQPFGCSTRTLPLVQTAVQRTSALAEDITPASPVAHNEQPGPPSSPSRLLNDAKFQLRFIVPDALIGALLGKNGANVLAIKEATGAFIQATRPGIAVPSSRERMIIVAGDTATACKAALRTMLRSLESGKMAHKLCRPGHPSRYFLKQVIPAGCAGKVLGPGGDQISAINVASNASVIIEAKPKNAAFLPFRYIVYQAAALENMADAVDAVASLLSEDARYDAGVRDIYSVAFKVVSIPEKRAGMLLGPGGAHIKALQDLLKVKIGIAEGQDGVARGLRYVSVYGTPSSLQVALDVIAVAVGQPPRERAAAGTSTRGDRSVAGGVDSGSEMAAVDAAAAAVAAAAAATMDGSEEMAATEASPSGRQLHN